MTLIGHSEAEKAFLEAWQGGRLHHAWLLAGPQGMGKGAFAARVARFLATHGQAGAGQAIALDDPGDAAAGKLVEAGNHPEIIQLARQPKDKGKELARNITIDQVRGVIRRLHLSLSLGDWRVIIVDAVDDLETDGANALLKQPWASCVTSAADVIELVGAIGDDLAPQVQVRDDPRDDLDQLSRRVLDAVPVRTPVGPARIASAAGVELRQVTRCLGALAARGLVTRTDAGWRLPPRRARSVGEERGVADERGGA